MKLFCKFVKDGFIIVEQMIEVTGYSVNEIQKELKIIEQIKVVSYVVEQTSKAIFYTVEQVDNVNNYVIEEIISM